MDHNKTAEQIIENVLELVDELNTTIKKKDALAEVIAEGLIEESSSISGVAGSITNVRAYGGNAWEFRSADGKYRIRFTGKGLSQISNAIVNLDMDTP